MQTEPLDTPSTYAVLTAEALLKKIGITLPKATVAELLQNPQSFHKQLLRALATPTALQFPLGQAEELDRYAKGEMRKLIDARNHIQATAGEASLLPTTAEAEFQAQLSKLQQQTGMQASRFAALTSSLQATEGQVQADMGRFISSWHSTQQGHAELVKERLKREGVELDKTQTARLQEAFRLQRIDPSVSADLLHTLKLNRAAREVSEYLVRILLDAGYEPDAIKAIMGKLEPDLVAMQDTNQAFLTVFTRDINALQQHAQELQQNIITLIEEMDTTAQMIAYTINHMPSQWQQAMQGQPAAVPPTITIGVGNVVTLRK
jgi:hypothetical protein